MADLYAHLCMCVYVCPLFPVSSSCVFVAEQQPAESQFDTALYALQQPPAAFPRAGAYVAASPITEQCSRCTAATKSPESCHHKTLKPYLLFLFGSPLFSLAPRSDDSAKPKFMTPDEVEGHIAALCRHESGILAHIYGSAELHALSRGSGLSSSLGGLGLSAKGSRGSIARAARADPGRLYKSFFLRALAVTPNRCSALWLAIRV